VTFDPDKGDHFFRSTLVQTLFYGVFSAWVLWARETVRSSPKFDWRLATWHLTVPFIRTLFQQIASPAHLQPLRLVEVLDWTAATLNHVDTLEFFKRFNDADAVQFFYEPFLEAFDPELRKELGVWYTPNEVVTYMVARVDKALREDLGIEDGLASDRVYVLDPCCGTGAFLSAVLKRIEASLDAKGFGGLKGQMVKNAALSRVFGFEIMPAPFVVAHLQVGLVLRAMGATLDTTTERAGVFLTNALTGWEPHVNKPLPFPELEEERSRSDKVKQKTPILVVIGNPPYNGFAGVTEGREERALTDAYKRPKKVRRPEGQGLNDLYVRFFRMAERRIVQQLTVEKKDLLSDEVRYSYTDGGSGIVCFISNYSWLDGLSFTVMRERYLEAFDDIRIDCLNGDKFKTGKTTPDGRPDPSIFSTEHNREGIQVGTAIATLVRKEEHTAADSIAFRHVWGTEKRQELLDTAETNPAIIYTSIAPPLELGLPFVSTVIGTGYLQWPRLPDLLPAFFPGVQTKRDDFLVDIDRAELEKRMLDYFDRKLEYSDFARKYPEAVRPTARYDPKQTRNYLTSRGIKKQNIVRYTYRAFDLRWCYWEPETKLLGEKSPGIFLHNSIGNLWLEAREKQTLERFDRGTICSSLPDNFGSGFSSFFPRQLHDVSEDTPVFNVPKPLVEYVAKIGVAPGAIFNHVTSLLHAPAYRIENIGALRMDWPRIPIPGDVERWKHSTALGDALTILLNPEAPAPGVSTGALRLGLRVLGLPTKRGGSPLDTSDLAMTAGWGSTQNAGGGTIVMPGRGLTVARDYTPAERASLEAEATGLGMALDDLLALIGTRTVDVHLNANAYWSNVPEKVWDYALGGYQVIKKWLSYRERKVLGRALKPEEVAYVSEMVRRIAAILMMGPSLDANYRACAADARTYEELGLSRDAVRERRGARTIKRGASRKLTPAMTPSRKESKKARGSRKKEPESAE
jgi:Type ISP C-terminal specificity domain/N-6 DNA Methylase